MEAGVLSMTSFVYEASLYKLFVYIQGLYKGVLKVLAFHAIEISVSSTQNEVTECGGLVGLDYSWLLCSESLSTYT